VITGIFVFSYIFRLDLSQVVLEHFLWQSRELFFLLLREFSGTTCLQIIYVSFDTKFSESNCRSGLFVKNYPNFKKKSVESESG